MTNINNYKNNEEAFKNFSPNDISIRHNTMGNRESYTLFIPKDLVRRPLAKDKNGNLIELTGTKKNGESYSYKQRINFVALPKGMQLKNEINGTARDVSGWTFVPYHKAVNNSLLKENHYEVGMLVDGIDSKTGDNYYIKVNPPRGSKEYVAGDYLITKTTSMVNQMLSQGAQPVLENNIDNISISQDITKQNTRSTKDRVTERAVDTSKSKSDTKNDPNVRSQSNDINNSWEVVNG